MIEMRTWEFKLRLTIAIIVGLWFGYGICQVIHRLYAS